MSPKVYYKGIAQSSHFSILGVEIIGIGKSDDLREKNLQNNGAEVIFRNQTAIVLFSVISSVIIYLILCILISNYFGYLDKVDISSQTSLFRDGATFAPQKVEKIEYFVGLLIIPICLLIFSILYKKLISICDINKINILYYLSSLMMIIMIVGLFILDLLRRGDTFLYFYKNLAYNTNIYNLYRYCYPYDLIIYTLIGLASTSTLILGFMLIPKCEEILNLIKNYLNNKVIIIISIISSILIAFTFICSVYTVEGIRIYITHLSAVMYSVTQVYHGKVLLADFANQYGLYPHFLEPIFWVIGLDTLRFSLVMDVLILISFISIFIFLYNVINNKQIVLLGFLTFLFYGFLLLKTDYVDPYYQYYPIRTLFPCIGLALISFYIKNNSKKLYYLMFILSSIAVLWNFESGIVIFITWILLLAYKELYSKTINSIVPISKHVITGIVVLATTVGLYTSYILLRYGQVPDYLLLFKYQYYFGSLGLAGTNITIFDAWNLIILLYIISLAFAIFSLISRKQTMTSTILFTLAILGAGLYSYNMGRNFYFFLIQCTYPAVLILCIMGDRLFHIVNLDIKFNQFDPVKIFALSTVMLIFIYSIIGFGLNLGFLCYWYPNNINSIIDKPVTNVTESVNFIKNNTNASENVVIISDLQSVYYAESGTVNPINIPGNAEIQLNSDLEKIDLYLINNTNTKVFWEDGIFFGNRSLHILEENYTLTAISSNNTTRLYEISGNK